MDGQACPAQFTSQQGGGRAARAHRTVGGADLVGHHDVPRLDPRREPTAETDQGHRIGPGLPDDPDGPVGLSGAHSGPDEDRARGQTGAGRGPGLQPQRRGHDQPRPAPGRRGQGWCASLAQLGPSRGGPGYRRSGRDCRRGDDRRARGHGVGRLDGRCCLRCWRCLRCPGCRERRRLGCFGGTRCP